MALIWPRTPKGLLSPSTARPGHYIVDLFKRLQECTLPVIARQRPRHGWRPAFFAPATWRSPLMTSASVPQNQDRRHADDDPAMHAARHPAAAQVAGDVHHRRAVQRQDALDWGVVNYVVPRAG
ncbi:hypothetical protein, partial [Candidatus Skiveiella danica]|uniref:hypothetical protein n=1 Tax=Candidatus Skiveiella danica TaxID=3386177 RepID=UPI0039B8C189